MKYFVATGNNEGSASWGLFPPVLPTGAPFAAAELITTSAFRDTKLVFPVSRHGDKTDLTFFYWQTYAATDKAKLIVESEGCSGVWFSPACSTAGDDLWIIRAPCVRDSIDTTQTSINYHPEYKARHPLAHLSGRIRSLQSIHLFSAIICQYDMFYIAEFPLMLIVSDRLVDSFRSANLTGFAIAHDPQISIC